MKLTPGWTRWHDVQYTIQDRLTRPEIQETEPERTWSEGEWGQNWPRQSCDTNRWEEWIQTSNTTDNGWHQLQMQRKAEDVSSLDKRSSMVTRGEWSGGWYSHDE